MQHNIEARPVGRPSGYSDELADIIVERLTEGESLRSICADEGMPTKAMVMRWLAQNPEFRDQYTYAREAQADLMADEMKDISDDGRNDWMEKQSASGDVTGWQINGEAARRSQIRIDARKWLIVKLHPKKYGDKQTVEVGHSHEDILAMLK